MSSTQGGRPIGGINISVIAIYAAGIQPVPYLRAATVANLDNLVYPKLQTLFIDAHLTVSRGTYITLGGLSRTYAESFVCLAASLVNHMKSRGHNALPSSHEGSPHQHHYTQQQCECQVF